MKYNATNTLAVVLLGLTTVVCQAQDFSADVVYTNPEGVGRHETKLRD
jgi:hypothetical protein